MSEKLPLTFDAAGLLPVVVQDHLTGEIRLLAYASAEAVRATMDTGRATFWSRSRGELWEKGRTSGNDIVVKRVLVDCDADALVYLAEPHGPSCHTDATSCFFQALEKDGLVQKAEQPQTTLARLEETLEARKASTAEKSYTKTLLDGGAPAIGAKLREEAGELAEALGNETSARVVSEAADVVFHLLVGLQLRGIAWRDVLAELEARSHASGHAEKASRV
jgi:phosphoribosyl-AMP cyclohydrolase / phosphoribosyl-ATP pyrophosphohydrolase